MTVHEPSLGNYFEAFTVGDVYQHPLGRTINETDNTWFTLLTMNTNQYHFNTHFSQNHPITKGRIIVNSGFTIALVLGMTVSDISHHAIVNLELTDIKLTHPVFVGDTVYAESIVVAKRESASRPYAGIVTVKTRGLNQDGDVVVGWTRSVMVYKESARETNKYFPQAKTGPLEI
ncbi:MAG: MaoC family dehydratase [Actinomycetes bacterium]|nr:MaoC family dehydratase [Actinomycetota bacterium]